MKRRRLLVTLVPAMVGAGCSSGYGGPTDQTREPTVTPTETPRDTPSGYFRSVSLTDQFLPSEDHQVDVAFELTEDWITSDHTATLDVTVTNRASETRTFYDFKEVEVRRGLFADNGAMLGPVTYAPKCIGTDRKEQGPFGEGTSESERVLAPNESLTVTFGVADDSRIQGCISPGSYRFDWNSFNYKFGTESEGSMQQSEAEFIPLRLGVKLKIEAPNE